MSTRFPGGIITKTPVVPTGPYEDDTASGIWTLDQQLQYQKAGIWPNPGLEPNYIEDTFSTYLYTGTSAAQTITNGIDLSGKGGLVWMKGRSGATDHALYDTARGATFDIASNLTTAQTTQATGLTAFGSTGFSIGALAKVNTSSATYVSWTFRKQPKFFDVVTYTGTGSNTTVAHNLGSVPGAIWVKRTNSTGAWMCYHRSLANTQYMVLNTDAAVVTDATRWNSTTPTSSVFSIGTDATVNASGGTYVAYLFAHNAGGFGLTGTDNVISCGSFTTDGSGDATINLGYEPQFLLTKRSDTTGNWRIIDSSRGMSVAVGGQGSHQQLFTNGADAESSSGSSDPIVTTATGFRSISNYSSATFIYIAIRRGPMKVPTVGTSVYNAIARTGTGAAATVTGVGFAPDLLFSTARNTVRRYSWHDRLRGYVKIDSDSTGSETTDTAGVTAYGMDGISIGTDGAYYSLNNSGDTYINHFFKRAPGFFDEVCYTGTGTLGQTYSHNLGVAPELMIVKCRAGGSYSWTVWNKDLAASGSIRILMLNTGSAFGQDNGNFNSTAPTASVFTVGNNFTTNGGTGYTYVMYLFATCPGVSKVGSYTGTGTTKQIDCGFTAGARFVLIKRTDGVADWYVWDTVRGIIAGNDPYLLLNSTAEEVTGTDYIDTYAAGFEISSTAPAEINANGGTFIFLAIA